MRRWWGATEGIRFVVGVLVVMIAVMILMLFLADAL